MLGVVYLIGGQKLERGNSETLDILGCIIADSWAYVDGNGV